VAEKVENPSTWQERSLKTNEWKDRFVFEHGGNRYELRTKSRMLRKELGWKRACVIIPEGVGSVGSIRAKGSWFSRECTVDLPEELPLEVKVFLVWVAVILRRREAAELATAGAGS